MSELAAAGAAFLAPELLIDDQEEIENIANHSLEESENSSVSKKSSHLAVPENDSISSSDDEDGLSDVFDTTLESSVLSSGTNNKNKTLPPRASLMQNGISSLKRSFTLPRNPLINLTNNVNGVKKAKKSAVTAGMKEDCVTSPTSSPSKVASSAASAAAKTASVRNLFNRLVSQATSRSTSTSKNGKNGGGVANKCDLVMEERIAEWKRRFLAENRVPGVVGIRNHGNTCFINAILQCLSFTDILAEYFVLDTYKGDLKRKKKLQAITALYKRSTNSANSADFCGRGEVTEQLATLLKSLWSLQYDPEISIRFKSLVEKNASQYKGGSQHDAQEFLLWLLDRVHEDLNVAPRRRSRKIGSNSNANGLNQPPSDEVLAAEALAGYMRFNSSFVMDVFQAQFRSSLTCPTCEKQSNTFDPFLCVSLPIPQKQLMPVYVTVLYIDQTPRQVKLGITVGVHDTIGDLRTMLSRDTGIERSQILLTEIDDLTFHRTFKDSDPVTVINANKPNPSCHLFCIEIMKHKEATEDDGAYVLLTWVNVLKEGPIEKRFGSPYTIQVSREIYYTDLQKLLMKEMASILHDDILISNQKVPLFKIRILDGLDNDAANYLDSKVELPMYTLSVEQAVNLCSVDQVAPHVKLALEWDAPAKSQIIADDRDFIEEHASVKQVAKCPEEATSVSLQECFSLYTKAETLGDGDAWFCPQCKRKQEVVKRMGLWSLPDVLIIHLKRFRQMANSNASNKLSTLVEFPLESVDMSPFVTKSNNSESAKNNGDIGVVENNAVNNSENNSSSKDLISNSKIETPTETSSPTNVWTNVLSTFKKDKQTTIESIHHHQPHNKSAPLTTNECFVYDLYAVCNHHGDDLQGGHYTATCRNPTDGQWYSFDDTHTSKVEENEVVSQDAYILFYQRQSLTSNPPSSSASSTSGSSGGSGQEHWVYRMPDFNYKNKTSSSSSTTTTQNGKKLTQAQQQANVRAVTSGSTMPIVKSESSREVKTATSTNEQPVTKDEADEPEVHQQSGNDEAESNNISAETKSLTETSTTSAIITSNGQNKTQKLLLDKISSDQTEEVDDVSRPIDKNDVD